MLFLVGGLPLGSRHEECLRAIFCLTTMPDLDRSCFMLAATMDVLHGARSVVFHGDGTALLSPARINVL